MAINEMNGKYTFKMVNVNRYWFVVVKDKNTNKVVNKVRYNTKNAAQYGIFYMSIA